MTLLRRIGATVLLVTHDQREAFVSSDRVAVMREGRIVQFDDPVLLYRQPADAQTARLVGAAVFLDGAMDGDGARTALGFVRAANRHGAGEAVQVMLRPEQLRLVVPEQGVAARVAEIAFHGQYSSLRVILETGFLREQAGSAGSPAIEFLVRAYYPFEHQIGDRVGVQVVGPGMIYDLAH